MDAPAKIVVRNLVKVFGNRPAPALQMLADGLHKDEIFQRTGQVVGVQKASFEIRAGEIFVIMGLSGSGKSTLIRLLNRLLEPTAGEVLVDGQDVASMDRNQLVSLRRRDMSMVFQSFALMPHRTVLENASFGLEIAGVDKNERERRALQVLDQVGLSAFARKHPAELSGGMQQRVGLARALAVDPSLMLMDEAFSALDPLKRHEMQRVLLDLQRNQKRTIVFVSHDLDEAFRIGDRIAIMEGGRVVQIGDPHEIARNPADDYVRAFFKGVDLTRHMTVADIARTDQVPVFPAPDNLAVEFSAAIEHLRSIKRHYGFVLDTGQHLIGVVSIDSLSRCLSQSRPALADALLEHVPALPGASPFREVLGQVARNPHPFPVVDGNGTYVGAVTQTILLEHMCDEETRNA
ncbi:MAG TPA: glycine betaine/L-proline ABC transporter ATP-binding protein ProV [Burkholderiaceae bacterium]